MADSEIRSHETPEDILEEEIRELETPTLTSGWLWAAAAVGLIVLFSSTLFIANWDRNQASARPIKIVPEAMGLREPLGKVSRDLTFRWDPVERAVTYVLLVKAKDREEVELLRPVRETFLKPSAAESANFNTGDYTWTIEARSSSGQLIGYGEGSFSIPVGE